MSIIVEHDKLGKLSFPDGMAKEDMANAIVEAEAQFGEQYGATESFATNLTRSGSSSVRGIGNWLGTNQSPSELRDDRIEEHKSRIMMSQNPKSSITGMLLGGFIDPVTLPALVLKPLTFASKALTYGTRGMALGAFGGALEPVYDQYGDSRTVNVIGSTVIGGLLGGGIGKLLTKKPDSLEEATDEALDNLQGSLDTPEKALASIENDYKLRSQGAEDQSVLDSLGVEVVNADKKIKALEDIQKGIKNPLRKISIGNQLKTLKASTENQRLDLASKKTKRDAQDNLNRIQEGKFSEVADLAEQIRARTATPRVSKIIAPVAQGDKALPLAPNPALNAMDNTTLFKRLGLGRSAPRDPYAGTPSAGQLGGETDTAAMPRFQGEQSGVGAGQFQSDERVAQQFMPRSQVAGTRRLADGRVSGENKEPINKIKVSQRAKDAATVVRNKQSRGEEPTAKDWDEHERAYQETEILKEYTDTVAMIARTRGLDTNANRFGSSGRYTFENISKSSAKFIKDNGIKDMDDMVKYIVDNPNKIFSADELAAATELMIEVDNKLFNTHALLKHADAMTDAEVAVLHNDIDVYYGIQSWFKGQGSKVSGIMNYRKKMYQDIADNRQIEQLFAGVQC